MNSRVLAPEASVLRTPQSPSARAVAASDAAGRIVLLSQLYPPDIGGSAVLLHETYSRIAGADLVIAADARTHQAGARPEGRLVPLAIESARWGIVPPGALTHYLRLAGAVRRLARRDAVVHCARALPEGVAAWMARQFGGPQYVVWTHGEDVVSALSSRELTFLQARVHAGAAALIANSRNTKQVLEEAGADPSRIHVIHPGVDAGRFHPEVDGTAMRRKLAGDAELVVLSVGRLQRRKGHDVAISAMAALKPRFPGLRYVIVGNGEERSRLEQHARDAGVADRVTFAGEVSASELPQCFAACDVFLMPNRVDNGDIEGFGIVFLEAAASGRPAIGGRSGGVSEAIAEGVTGLLVGGTDVPEVADAVARLLQDAPLRHRFGSAGRRRVLQSFTWDAAAKSVRALQLRLVKGEVS